MQKIVHKDFSRGRRLLMTHFGGGDTVFAFPCCQGSGTPQVSPRRRDWLRMLFVSMSGLRQEVVPPPCASGATLWVQGKSGLKMSPSPGPWGFGQQWALEGAMVEESGTLLWLLSPPACGQSPGLLGVPGCQTREGPLSSMVICDTEAHWRTLLESFKEKDS